MPSKHQQILGVAVALAFVGGACGSSAENNTTEPASTTTAVPATTTIPEATTLPETTTIPETTAAPASTTGPETTLALESSPATTGASGGGAANSDVAVANGFWLDALAQCNDLEIATGGLPLFDGGLGDPTVGVSAGERVADGVFVFTDNNGVVLLVDVNNFTVTGPDGPDGVLPRPYSFVCPFELFVGTFDEGDPDEDELSDEDEANFGAADVAVANGFWITAVGQCNDMVIAAGGVAPFDGGPDDPTTDLLAGERVADGVFEFTDTNGVVLLVDVNNFTVTGPDGPDGVMPRPYSFVCPPEVFVGTIDE